MNISNLSGRYARYRLALEKLALYTICSCQYYDLADCIDGTSDQELIILISGQYDCDMCGHRGGPQGVSL